MLDYLKVYLKIMELYLKKTAELELQPLVFNYLNNKGEIHTRISENFVLYYKLQEDIENNKIVGYYRYDEEEQKEIVIVIENDEFLFKSCYVTDYIKINNKVLLFYTEELFDDYNQLTIRKQELENEGKTVLIRDLCLYSRFLLQ